MATRGLRSQRRLGYSRQGFPAAAACRGIPARDGRPQRRGTRRPRRGGVGFRQPRRSPFCSLRDRGSSARDVTDSASPSKARPRSGDSDPHVRSAPMTHDTPASESGKLSVVRWRREAYERALPQPREQPIPRLLRAFLDRARAEAFCLDLEQGRRSAPAHANPFLALPGFRGPLQPDEPYDRFYIEGLDVKWLTRFAEPILNDWLLDAGLTPPEPIHLHVRHSSK